MPLDALYNSEVRDEQLRLSVWARLSCMQGTYRRAT